MKLKQKINKNMKKLPKLDFSKAKKFLADRKMPAAIVLLIIAILVVGFSVKNEWRDEETVMLKGAAPNQEVSLKEAILMNNAAIQELQKKVQDEAMVMQGIKKAICDPAVQ
jgi:hypothetical protein